MDPDFIVFAVIIIFAIGLAGMLCALMRVCFYSRNLDQYKKNYKKQIRQEGGKVILKTQKEDRDPLDERCRILEEVLADANGACRIPELHDLNEYTIQVEFAGIPPSLLRIIISFLLIVGIFGTLSGVEGLLNNGNIDIKELPPALRPSMFAVGGTVLLLWARGIYDYFFRKYLQELNSFTMEKLLPALPLNFSGNSGSVGLEQLQSQNRGFQNDMSDFKKSVNALEGLCKNLTQEKELLSNKVNLLDKAAEGVTGMTVRIKENEKLHGVISNQHQVLLADVPESVEDIKLKLSMLKQLNQVMDSITGVFLSLAESVEGTGRQMKDLLEVAEEIPTFTGEMREYSDSIRQMCEMRAKFSSASESLENQIKELAHLEQSISEKIETPARTFLDELQTLLQSRQIQQNDFDAYLKGYDAEVKKIFASIQKSIDDFEIKSCNDLAKELDKRTDELGI